MFYRSLLFRRLRLKTLFTLLVSPDFAVWLKNIPINQHDFAR